MGRVGNEGVDSNLDVSPVSFTVTVANFNKVGLSVVKRLDQAIKVPSPFTEKNLDTLLYNCSSLPNS